MTLRYLAETFSRDYDFRVVDENEKGLGCFERNEIVKLNYKIADYEVLKFEHSKIYFNTIYVTVKRGQ